MRDPKAELILAEFDRLVSERSTWENLWQELKDLVRPNTDDFGRKQSDGARMTDKIWDGTAPKSLTELASGLHSYLTSPVERWFFVTVMDEELLMDDGILSWLEDVSDIIYAHYSYHEMGFNPSLHESYLDLGAFGTSVLFQERDPFTYEPIIRAFPLAQCWIRENASGKIDTVYRKVTYTTRQMRQLFQMLPDKIRTSTDESAKWTMIHAVYPRRDRDMYLDDSKNMAFASCWVNVEERFMCRESGFLDNPYHVARWVKIAGEVYGRSPAMDCLPDIRMLNAMSKTIIKGAQKIVDPPIICDDDGVLLPLKTHPGATILKTPGADKPEPLLTGGRVDIGLDMMDQRRQHIQKSFFIDYLRASQKKERQSQLEIADNRDEMHRMMAPMLGRLHSEELGPMLVRTYNLLSKMGRIPKAPDKLIRAGKNLRVTYISPAARAQMSSKIQSLQQALADAAAFSQYDPSALDLVNTDSAVRMIFTLRDVSRKVLRTPQELAQIRAQRQQQQALAAATEHGSTAASGIKDLAQAKLLNAQAAAT